MKLLFFCLWLILTIFDVLFYTYLWQIKEYRLDRLWDHIKIGKGKRSILNTANYARIFAIIILVISLKFSNLQLIMAAIVIGLYGYLVIKKLIKFFRKGLTRPVWTSKALIITSCSFLSLFVLGGKLYFQIKGVGLIIALITIQLLIFFIVAVWVYFLRPVTYLLKKRVINLAARKIAANPGLIVIGITGSYGKTTTKEFITDILAVRFRVAKTRENINTDIGVAQTILKYLKPDDQVFVVEMGAYKKGEIKAICDIVKPKIGIITGINDQHLSLFGSIEKTMAAKYELIESLPVAGTAIFNGDNKYCVELAEKTTGKEVITYSLDRESNIYATTIEETPKSVKFTVNYLTKQQKFQSPIIGKYNIRNLLAAITVGLKMGLSITEIAGRSTGLNLPSRTMELKNGQYGAILIDDSYNANPDGVIVSLEHLKSYPDEFKKILIITHLLELGESAINNHKRIGKKAGQICDYFFIISPDFSEYLIEGAVSVGFDRLKIIVNENKEVIINEIKRIISAQSVILFEGRGTEKILKEIEQT